MNRVGWIFLLVSVVSVLSCSTDSTLIGLWQSSEDEGTIEFKSTGEVVATDSLAATVTGRYQIEEDGSLTLELTGSDIFRDSVQPTARTVIKATFELEGDELKIRPEGEDSTESYRRIRGTWQ